MGPLIRDNLRRLTVLGALVCAGQPVSAQAGVKPVDPDDFELYTFSIYNTQVAKELAAYADEHLAAGRYAEAMVALQQLLDEHKGEVLGGRRINIGDMDRKSQQPVHEGASEFATRRLFELAPSERALASGGSTGLPKLIVPKSAAAYDSEHASPLFRAKYAVLVPGPLSHALPLLLCSGIVLLPRCGLVRNLWLFPAHVP